MNVNRALYVIYKYQSIQRRHMGGLIQKDIKLYQTSNRLM